MQRHGYFPIGRPEAEAFVDAAAGALSLAIGAEHRDGVVGAFQTLVGLAAELAAQPLRPEDEAAMTFAPLGPGDAPLPDRRRR